MTKTMALHTTPRYPMEGKPYSAIMNPPTLGANDLIVEWTAMLSPSMAPESPLSTDLVTLAVKIELTRQSEHVSGNRTPTNSYTVDIRVCTKKKFYDFNAIVQ